MRLPEFSRAGLAHVLPFALFMAALALVGLLESLGGEDGPAWLTGAKYWVYPLQTLACGAALAYFWKDYAWGCSAKALLHGAFWGAVVFFLWVSPQMFFGAPHRGGGFDPYALGDGGAVFWVSLVARMLRLAIVVPLLEEIFWRGFLMRYFIGEKNWARVPFGTPSLASFSAVVILFSFVHSFEDFFGAIAAGVVYNALAVGTRSLGACVLAHAVTNLLLGIYVLQTRQWGFW